MIYYCPHCGHRISQPINCGITSCSNCRRIFDSSRYHRLLAAGWLVRRNPGLDREQLVQQHQLTFEEADLVVGLISEQCYGHQEFNKILISLGLKDRFVA